MTEWHEIHRKIDDLQRKLSENETAHTLHMTLSVLQLVVSKIQQHELDCGRPYEKAVTEMRLDSLAHKVEFNTKHRETEDRELERRMQQSFAAINEKLDAILAHLQGPPPDFGE
jgi:hypothetical protein